MEYVKIFKSIARMDLDNESKKIIIEFVNEKKMDNVFLNKIFTHKLQHLIYKHLYELKLLDKIDSYDQESLIAQFVFWQLRYSEYLEIVKILTKSFNENKINYSFLKGVSLVNGLYTNNSLVYRRFGDIDILIEKNDIKNVDKILNSHNFVQGYINEDNNIIKAKRSEIIYWRLNSHQEHGYIEKSIYSLYIPNLINFIDVNTTIFEGGKIELPLSTSKILENKHDCILSKDTNIQCLNYTYGLLQLCYHFYKDAVYESKDYSLIKFCDLREYILKFRKVINWDEFITIINNHSIGDKIYYTLFLVSNFYGDLGINDILTKIEADKNNIFPCWDEIFSLE